ncbi:MAG TPA: ABC transporter ATP-binding protein [Ramlibacter sp.]|uniref:ABC transporter ATP-binding protein n=1 Tax=Ramlibacter sp. TaxID=1917967 RepID=UPI002CD82DB0|nr:ABC transporter ATP-binding protein [Ramlibacter sp.]HVZ45757.1 ABC transporter ATP-binding protein [Ramlibacter sp.]
MTLATIALEARGLSKRFGALHVTQDVSLALHAGARTALIGPNGAGKTTLVNLLTGMLRADAGSLHLFGEDLTRSDASVRTRKGLVRTFQISSLFAPLTVFENVFIAVAQAGGRGFSMWKPAARERHLLQRTEALVVQLDLQADMHRPVGEIAYGRQRLVEIAIALALEPRVLLLDEPAAGIPSTQLDLLHRAMDSLPAEIAVLMIEHDMHMVRRFASQVAVLVEGALLMCGEPREVMAHPQVQSVYLGTSGRERFEGRLAHA